MRDNFVKDRSLFFKAFLWAFLVLVMAAVTFAFVRNWFQDSFRSGRKGTALPVYGRVPDFAWVDQAGKSRGLRDFLGRVWVLDFIFTRCAGQCPLMSKRMASLQQDFSRFPNVRFVSVSVDPSWDSPERLSRYAEKYHARSDRWLFLTGEKEKIYPWIRRGFRLGVEESGGSSFEPVMHSNRFVLMDGKAQSRGFYDATDEAALRRLRRDIRALLDERI